MGKPLVPSDTIGWVRNQIQQKLAVLTTEETEIVRKKLANDVSISSHESHIESLRLSNDKLAEMLNEKKGEIAAYREELNRQFRISLQESKDGNIR